MNDEAVRYRISIEYYVASASYAEHGEAASESAAALMNAVGVAAANVMSKLNGERSALVRVLVYTAPDAPEWFVERMHTLTRANLATLSDAGLLWDEYDEYGE